MSDRLLNIEEVIAIVGCGKSTWHKWRKAKACPEGVKVNGLRRWWETEIVRWINGRSKHNDPAPSTLAPSQAAKPKRTRLAKHVKKRTIVNDNGELFKNLNRYPPL